MAVTRVVSSFLFFILLQPFAQPPGRIRDLVKVVKRDVEVSVDYFPGGTYDT